MGEGRAFAFNILVVEDEPNMRGDLERDLKEVIDNDKNFNTPRLVSSGHMAWDDLFRKRYHFISIDQNIPDNEGEPISADHGLSLWERIVEKNLLIYRIIYTAFGDTSYSNRTGRFGGTPYLEKKIGREKAGAYSSYEWAEYIKSTLEHDYIPFALEQAGRHLPLSLAERARRALAAYHDKNFESYIRLWIEIWESILHLAFAQTLALCHQAGISLGRIPGGTLAEQEQILRDAWPKLAQQNWMQPWLRYIGVGNRESGAGAGGLFLRSASDPLRQLRNELAHSFPADAWDQLTAEYKDPLLFLIDALAFWIENPLLLGARYHPTQRRRVVGTAIMGDQVPFPLREIDIHDLAEIPKNTDEHICLIWHHEENQSMILDLYPFVMFDRDPQGRPHLMLLARSTKQSDRWMYRSLSDGRLHSRFLPPAARQTIQTVFR